jgi:hypothetical protein
MNHAKQIVKLLIKIENQIRPLEDAIQAHAFQFGWESDDFRSNHAAVCEAERTNDEAQEILLSDNDCDLALLEHVRAIRKAIDAANFMCVNSYNLDAHYTAICKIRSSVDEAMQVLLKAVPGNEQSDITLKVITTQKNLELTDLKNPYNLDICKTLWELASCFENKCFIAVMCLCGRIMEAALKLRVESMPEADRNPVLAEYLDSQKPPLAKTFDRLSLQQLVELSKKFSRCQIGWLTPGLEEGAKLVQLYRNMNAHARNNGKIAFPNDNNATTVISVILDLLGQTSESLSEQSNSTKTETFPK